MGPDITSTDTEDPRIERTRAAVLEAAVGLLEEHGVDKLTHGNVASEARVSRTTVYRHWPTRHDLLVATFECVGGPKMSEPHGDLRDDLTTFLSELAEHLGDEEHAKVLASVIERALGDPLVAEIKRQMAAEGLGKLITTVQRAVDAGELRADLDVELAANGLAGTLFLRRFVAEAPIGADIVERLIDDFIRANQH